MNKKVLALALIVAISVPLLVSYFIYSYQNGAGQTVKLVPAQTSSSIIQGNTYYFTYIHYNSAAYESGQNYFAVTNPSNPDIHLQEIPTETGKRLSGAYIADLGKQYEISLYKNFAINVTVSEVNNSYLVLHVRAKTP